MTDDKLNQITRNLKSVQLDDEDASKYFINYLNDTSDELASETSEIKDENMQDEGDHAKDSSLSLSLIVTPVPQDLFTDQVMKDEFEGLFRIYDSHITVLYLKFFQRVRVTFTSSQNALQARLHLHERSFHGVVIHTYFASPIILRGANADIFLRPPEPEKLFLISPPVSPPVGWEQKIEDPPIVDLNLIAAIAQLQPNVSHELLPREHGFNTPSIIIHTCEDSTNTEEVNESLRQKLIKPTIIQTKRPAADH